MMANITDSPSTSSSARSPCSMDSSASRSSRRSSHSSRTSRSSHSSRTSRSSAAGGSKRGGRSSPRSASCKRRLPVSKPHAAETRRGPKRTKSVDLDKKSVRFQVDEKNNVRLDVREICCDFSEAEQSTLWWSQTELKDILEREQNVFEVFSNCCGSYIDNILLVWENCKNASTLEESLQQRDEVSKIVNAPARGMENDVITTYNAGYRERSIKCILDTQRRMASEDPEVRLTTMRRRYRHLTRTASRFAKCLAEGDIEVASELYR